MYSCLLVALFAFLSLPVFARPVCHSGHCHHHSFAVSPTDDCSEPSGPSTPPVPNPTAPSTPVPTVPSSPSPPPEPSSTPAPPPTDTPTPSPTSAIPPAPSSPASSDTGSNGPFSGGVATYFYQGGNAGACGQVNQDNALIAAMDQARFGDSGSSPLCGKQVLITNLNNHKTVTVTIADDCPTCDNSNSIDLSVGAFTALEPDLSVGEFPISWVFV